MNTQNFYDKVYFVIKHIPEGKVTTYGAIARYLGSGISARMVGWALNSYAGRGDLPCHRVVNRKGELTGARHFSNSKTMRELLEAEGVLFVNDAVDMAKYFWDIEIQDF